MTFRSLLRRLLLPAVLVIPALVFAGWLARGAQLGELLLALAAGVAGGVLLAILASLLWGRPDNRETKSVSGRDAALLVVVWLLWIVGAFLPAPAGAWVLGLAVIATIVAIILAAQELKRVANDRVDAAVDHLRSQGANPTFGQPRSGKRMPEGAGSVIEAEPSGPVSRGAQASRETFSSASSGAARAAGVGAAGAGAGAAAASAGDAALPDSAVEPPSDAAAAAPAAPAAPGSGRADEPARFSAASAAADADDDAPASSASTSPAASAAGADEPRGGAAMPGSRRVGPGVLPESESTRPGVNFGVNRAPVAKDWDPNRAVGPRWPTADASAATPAVETAAAASAADAATAAPAARTAPTAPTTPSGAPAQRAASPADADRDDDELGASSYPAADA